MDHTEEEAAEALAEKLFREKNPGRDWRNTLRQPTMAVPVSTATSDEQELFRRLARVQLRKHKSC